MQMHADWAEPNDKTLRLKLPWTGVTSIERNPSHGQNSWLSSSPGWGMLINSPCLEDCYTTQKDCHRWLPP